MDLFVVLGIHEAVVVAILVEEFHGDLIHVDLLDRVAGAKAMLEHGAGANIAQFGLNEGPQVAGSTVLHAEDQMQVVVVFNDHPRTHLGCWNCHELKSSP